MTFEGQDRAELGMASDEPVKALAPPCGIPRDMQGLYRTAFIAQDLTTVLGPYERAIMTLQAS